MPQIGHAFVGLGLGAATLDAPRKRRLRFAWLGVMLLAALLPDVVEWYYLVCGGPLVPHSSFASVFSTALSILICSTILRFALGERAVAAHLLVAAAIFSHTMLDVLDGGIPLWWPFSDAVVGVEWLGRDDAPLLEQLAKEFVVLGPFFTIGIVLGLRKAETHRGRRVPLPPWKMIVYSIAVLLSLSGAILSLLFPPNVLPSFASSLVGLPECLGLAGMAIAVIAAAIEAQPTWLRYGLVSAVPLLPAFVLGGLEVAARLDIARAYAVRDEGDLLKAADLFDRAAGWHALSSRFIAQCNAARCYWQAGEDAESAKRFATLRATYGPQPTLLYYEAQFRLGSNDPAYHDAASAEKLAQDALATSRSEVVRAESRKIIDAARNEMDG
ncbi:MAG: metal-dependent hydrolase [Phycisphaerae bacterium]